MKVRTLIGRDLNRWVAQAIGCFEAGDRLTLRFPVAGERHFDVADWRPSELWSLGGPILEQEGVCTFYDGNGWHAESNAGTFDGPTLLVAAMRAYVASEFGEDVEG